MYAVDALWVLAAEGGAGKLFPQVPDVTWSIINFLVLLFLLNRFLFKPLLGMISSREQDIEGNLKKAAEDRAEAERLRKEFAEQVAGAQRQAQEILREATANARASADQIVSDARDKSTVMVERAQEAIAREKEQALTELREEVASLAVAVAGKVLDRTITDADQLRLAQQFVAEVGKH